MAVVQVYVVGWKLVPFNIFVPHIFRNMKLNLQYYFGVKENISKCSTKSPSAYSRVGWIINSIFSETNSISCIYTHRYVYMSERQMRTLKVR